MSGILSGEEECTPIDLHMSKVAYTSATSAELTGGGKLIPPSGRCLVFGVKSKGSAVVGGPHCIFAS